MTSQSIIKYYFVFRVTKMGWLIKRKDIFCCIYFVWYDTWWRQDPCIGWHSMQMLYRFLLYLYSDDAQKIPHCYMTVGLAKLTLSADNSSDGSCHGCQEIFNFGAKACLQLLLAICNSLSVSKASISQGGALYYGKFGINPTHLQSWHCCSLDGFF